METYKLTDLTFTYPERKNAALSSVSFSINDGQFITVCGKSGCGKTTLLRLLKPSVTPHGKKEGSVLFQNTSLSSLSARDEASKIGFVSQNPENQIVTDKVWHELSFGLESLGVKNEEIRTRVAEISSFFGISTWFHNKTCELSGGQKQILNLASVMVMQPSVLLLDEPTSRLDPIAAAGFLKMLEKINRELGVTVILCEHRLEAALPMSDRVIVLDEGRVIADAPPEKVCGLLKSSEHDMFFAMPTPMRVHDVLDTSSDTPVTVREGKAWLENFSKTHEKNEALISPRKQITSDTVLTLSDVYFRYGKTLPDVIKGLSAKVRYGEIFAILGGNGTGKTTALSIMGGVLSPYRGSVLTSDGVKTALLPQDPQLIFTKKTVFLDLYDMLRDEKLSREEKERRVFDVASLCRIESLLDFHPYDLSGGEQQRAAFAKVLLSSPDILLLDEPTKGLDAHFKSIFADILLDIKADGKTVVLVSHDIDFCAEFADRCAMLFDGNIVSCDTPDNFFAGKSFYTTAANIMARGVLPQAVLANDIIISFGGKIEGKKEREYKEFSMHKSASAKAEKRKPFKTALGFLFILSFTVLCAMQAKGVLSLSINTVQLLAALLFGGASVCFVPERQFETEISRSKTSCRLTKGTLFSALLYLLAVPVTIYTGIFLLGDRKYLFISVLIIIETLIPFAAMFEARKPKAREIVLIGTLCALAAMSRTAFFMLPQFKPVIAFIIISGVCLGGEAGFLIGAAAAFISNMFFGQGPWTPWQMFVFGVIGFAAGLSFKYGLLRKTKLSLCVFGFLATLILYGGIMNPAAILMFQPNPTKEMLMSSYISGLPFDLIHAASTAFFLWFTAEPMIEKIERIKVKYDI